MDEDDRTPEVPDTHVAEEQAPTADDAQQGSTPPWGEDFNAERAWSTIQTQRQAEKDLKAQVAEYEQLLGNPDALLNQLGYETVADQDEQQFDPGYQEQEDPLAEIRGQVDQIQGTLANQQAQEVHREMGDHIDTLLAESDLKLTKKQKAAITAEAWNDGDPSPSHTAQTVKDWADDLAAYRDEAVSGYRKSKRAPRAAPQGQPGSKQVDFSNEEERQRMFAELMAAEGEQ